MYLGESSLRALQSWISGIRVAERLHGVKEEDGIFPFLAEFEVYMRVKKKAGATISFGLAKFQTAKLKYAKGVNLDEEGFHLWMKWYDGFLLNEKGIKMPTRFRSVKTDGGRELVPLK